MVLKKTPEASAPEFQVPHGMRKPWLVAGFVAAVMLGLFVVLKPTVVVTEPKVTQAAVAHAPRDSRLVTAVDQAFAKFAAKERAKLASTRDEKCVVGHFPALVDKCKCLWKDVGVSLPLDDKIMKKSDGMGSADKAMIQLDLLFSGNKKDCVVYGMGIADDSSFETYAAKTCTTYGFDCTVGPTSHAVKDKPFIFQKTCITGPSGEKSDLGAAGNVYGGGQTDLKFEPLEKVMAGLGHESIDVLKLDIEGSEWDLLHALAKVKDRRQLPRQILFELHTEGANPKAVPEKMLKGKSKPQVHDVLMALHDVGYRVINMDVNFQDCTCAEFAMVLVNK